MKKVPGTGESSIMSMEMVLARLLRIGSILAAILLAAGIAAMLMNGASCAPHLIKAGLIVLLLTPVSRVLVAALVFAKDRDWLFSLFCLIVLCSLALGVRLGISG